MMSPRLARSAAAFALIYEYANIWKDPSTYQWLLHHQLHQPLKSDWATCLSTNMFGIVATMGMESYCLLAIIMAASLALCKSLAVRMLAIVVLLLHRSAHQSLSDRAQIFQPSDSYVFWNLVLLGAMDTSSDELLNEARIGAYASTCLGYAFSGMLKAGSPSWSSGNAVHIISKGVTARPICCYSWMASFLCTLSPLLTWSVLAFELLGFSLLASFGDQSRRAAVVMSATMHLGLLVIVDVPWISLHMLAHHASLLAADAETGRMRRIP